MVHRNEYRKRMAAISNYMQKFRVPFMVQDRVKLWMQYTWEHQKIFDENKVLSFLPPKMRTDLALKVHYATLSKVKLFQDCDTGLLKELVVKLRPMIFLPGDYICRKDDIGKEMYIVQSGYVTVMTPSKSSSARIIMATLGEGSVFGEIALLGIAGMSRRTADVISKGFSNLFTLRKEDLEEALKHYPDAKRILNAKARRLMKENEERNAKRPEIKSMFKLPTRKEPVLMETVMSLRRKQSIAAESSLYVSGKGRSSPSVSGVRLLCSEPEEGASSGLQAPLSCRSSLASTSFGFNTDTAQSDSETIQVRGRS